MHCKVSGLVTEADWHRGRATRSGRISMSCFDCFGADRLLAGSDWPVCTLAADYSRTISLIDQYLEGRPASRTRCCHGRKCRTILASACGEDLHENSRRALLPSVVVAMSLFGGCGSSSPDERGEVTIAVIPKGTSHVFWQSIHAGAEKAAQELGVEVIWRGPLREDDRASQIAEVEGFITRGVSGIVLAPLDEAALVGPVDDAARAKIPVVIIDSGLKGIDYVSFVATDNRKGGTLAGEGLAKHAAAGRQSRHAALCRRIGQHDTIARKDFSRRSADTRTSRC